MSSRFKNQPNPATPVDDAETVAALVRMLSGMGIERSRINAMISKTSRAAAASDHSPRPENANLPSFAERLKRLA